ncbi:MAG: adenosine kinase [Acidimicrobiales bacterium]|jgi:sugar/nucleoside kinase (ribokinase family)|nr:adenosine kinase [Acidimicrobiales bacterium]
MTDHPFDVVCIGNAIVDVIAHADEGFLGRHGMVKGTMQLIDDGLAHRLYEDMGPGVEISGGSAANTAAGIASFGGRVGFVGRVADDQLGEVFTHDIRASGVHYEPAPVVGGPATARCLILVTPDAQRTMNTFLGASSLITPDDVDEALTGSAQVVYAEGYLWDQPAAKDAIRLAMDAAIASGNKVALTLSDMFCVDRHRADFLELAEHRVDVLFANEAEICHLYETSSFDEAADRVAAHCELACLTRSEKGSVIIGGDGVRIDVPPAPVDHVVDTTGAGDLYAAGFLYGFTNGFELETCGRFGALAAAEVISHVGARPEVSLRDLAGV